MRNCATNLVNVVRTRNARLMLQKFRKRATCARTRWAALKEARNKEEISGQQISDMQAFVRARAGKFGSALIRKDGTMAFSDQNVDVLSRWLFPAAYVVAFGTVTAMAGVVGA